MKIRAFFGILVMMSASGGWASGDTAVNAAIEDLAARLKIPVEEVVVISHNEKTWRDTAMGCERVGVKISEVMTKGSELVLIADGQRHFYQARPGASYQYCVTPATKKRGPIGPPVQ
jgi:hypothetical protein